MSGMGFNVKRLLAKREKMLSGQNNDESSSMSLQDAIESEFWSIPESVHRCEEQVKSPVNIEDIGSILHEDEEPEFDGLFETLSNNRSSPIDSDELLNRPKKLDDDEDGFDASSVRTSELTFTSSEKHYVGDKPLKSKEIDEPKEDSDDNLFPFPKEIPSIRNSNPDVVLKQTIQIANQEIPSGVDPRSTTFYFSEIASPIHFWFQYSQYFATFSNDLNAKYSKFGKNELNIEKHLIQPGMFIACFPPHFKSWHRAKVLTPLNENDEARVFMIDYGTVGIIPSASMKFLLREFFDVPKLSNRGRIPNLVPFNSITFPVSSVRKIFGKFSNKRLEGNVLRYDEVEDFYELELYYRNHHGELINVRDWLLEQEIASELHELGPHDILPLCYHLPTFEKLENDYPTFTELDFLEQHHSLDMDILIRTNFLENNVEEERCENPKLREALSKPKLKDVKKFYDFIL